MIFITLNKYKISIINSAKSAFINSALITDTFIKLNFISHNLPYIKLNISNNYAAYILQHEIRFFLWEK